jgi:3-methylcrotonyl-CoA carboxylase alpha subunit
VIEEAPSPTLNARQRETVCAAARKAAAAVNYVGAGTVEFVSDGKDVYFIEMNTRLQVEHPVTELITGIDLVEWQLRVAFGEKLPMTQDQITMSGHAIEARVYAEDPARSFMPSVGKIRTWRAPDEGGGLRIDAGYRAGDTVSPYYDAMLAKVIAWAPTREGAIDRLDRGLSEIDVRGIVTNLPFLSALVTHKAVRANRIDTGFIERELAALTKGPVEIGDFELAAAVAAILDREATAASPEAHSPWRAFGWMPVGQRQRKFLFRSRQGAEHPVTLSYGNGPTTLAIGNHTVGFSWSARDDGFDVMLDDVKSRAVAVFEGQELYLRTRNGRFELHWVDPFGGESDDRVAEEKITAPLPGTVVALLVSEGATLEKGAPILTLEVMKMEQTLRAPYAGVLKKLKCKVGDIVKEGIELAEVERAAA